MRMGDGSKRRKRNDDEPEDLDFREKSSLGDLVLPLHRDLESLGESFGSKVLREERRKLTDQQPHRTSTPSPCGR